MDLPQCASDLSSSPLESTFCQEALLRETYQDAIGLSRAIGFSYLWIDAFCIVQEDVEDWNIESAKMGGIYGNAALTLCASNASRVSEGFLKDRDPAAIRWGSFRVGETIKNIYLSERPEFQSILSVSLVGEPLTQRGW